MLLNTSDALDNSIFISLVIFEVLFLIAFAAFCALFFVRRKLSSDEYDIKTRFNEINTVSNIDSFEYLNVLSKNNPQLESLMNDINNAKKFFDQQINLVKDKIFCLTEENDEFSFTSANELRAQINEDLNSCSFMADKLRKISNNATTYSKNVSDLLIKYRSITDKILQFYDINLSLTYSNKIFKDSYLSIVKRLSEASNYVLKIDNAKFITELNVLNKLILNFYEQIKTIYILDRTKSYLNSSIKFVEKEKETKSKVLSAKDSIEVDKRFALAVNNTKDLETYLKNVELTHAMNSAMLAVKHIETASKIITQSEKVNILIQKSIKYLNDQISVLGKKTNIVTKTFQTIIERFKRNDEETIDAINKVTVHFKTIALSYQLIDSDFSRFEQVDKDQFLTRIHELMNNIKGFKQEIEDLILMVSTKYKKSIELLDEIADIKLTLSQLLGMKIELNSTDNESMSSIKTTISKIDQLEQLINEDYFNNYKKVYEEIQETKDQVISIVKTCTFDNTLKIYCQKMFIYLNKYRNEDPEISNNLDLAERYYRLNKFEDALNFLIETLKIIKESTELNNVAFN